MTCSHAAQYITCDHSCVISAGLMSDNTNNVCSAVMNDVTSLGDGGGRVSSCCELFAPDSSGRPMSGCRRDANFVTGLATGGGEAARLGVEIADDGALEPLVGGDPGISPFAFCSGAGFFLLAEANVRRNAHSDSNCTDSNSLDSGE